MQAVSSRIFNDLTKRKEKDTVGGQVALQRQNTEFLKQIFPEK
jgi:hypothetical protein